MEHYTLLKTYIVIAFTMGLFACFLGIITSMCYGIVPYDEDYSNINSTLNGISNASINIIASVNNTIIHTKQMASDNKSEGNVFAGMCFPSNDPFKMVSCVSAAEYSVGEDGYKLVRLRFAFCARLTCME
jgi:hypothetical protein